MTLSHRVTLRASCDRPILEVLLILRHCIQSPQKQFALHQTGQDSNKCQIVCRAVKPAPPDALDVCQDGPQRGPNLVLLRLNAHLELVVCCHFCALVDVGRMLSSRTIGRLIESGVVQGNRGGRVEIGDDGFGAAFKGLRR